MCNMKSLLFTWIYLRRSKCLPNCSMYSSISVCVMNDGRELSNGKSAKAIISLGRLVLDVTDREKNDN